jgi:hypothetical protein
MKVLHPKIIHQLFIHHDQVRQHDLGVADHRVRWVARRCRVSLATATTLAVIAGLFDREDR